MREGDPEYFTSAEVAELLRVDISTVARWARLWERSKAVHVTRTPGGHGGGHFRFLAADIRDLLRARADHPAGGEG